MKKQSQMLSAVLLVLLVALPVQSQVCSIGSSNDLLQSGTQQIFNSFGSAPSFREHRYQFNLNFAVPIGRSLQVAACTYLSM